MSSVGACCRSQLDMRNDQGHLGAQAGNNCKLTQLPMLCVLLQLFYQTTNELEVFLVKAATQELVDAFAATPPGPAAEEALFGLFAEYVVQNYSAELQSYRYL